MKQYMAHSACDMGKWHPLKDHLTGVANLAAKFAKELEAEQEAYLAGLLHDLGKYGDLFQRRLHGKESGIDHWSLGAWAAVSLYPRKAFAAFMAVAGHHLGLSMIGQSSIDAVNPAKYNEDRRRLSEKSLDELLARLAADGIELPAMQGFEGEIGGQSLIAWASAMLDYRMLFSALVDADYLDTEAHFKRKADGVKRIRQDGPSLEPKRALKILLDHIEKLAAKSKSNANVNQLRADLLNACLEAADAKPGRFTLSAPTGSGKTLSMLAFALKHAQKNGLRRVVMVIPYLSIIDQTARVFRKVFAQNPPVDADLEHYILEHHSMAGLDRNGKDADADAMEESERRRRELSQNWDAPIIITTSVQMLESLFSNRPMACRKLHRLAKSVILFDEVQTLPTHLAAATLSTLGRLCDRFGSTVVFSTATQPAFTELSDKAENLGGAPWRPGEIAPPKLGLFKRVKRVRVQWPSEDEALTPLDVATELAKDENRRSLCVVNTKRQARDILKALHDQGVENLFHLSTSMCPAHRAAVLGQVTALLDDDAKPPVRLISTQVVEAGVDLDFPVVWRAWGPLTSIAQAAGRGNRNGNLDEGIVRVFRFADLDPETGEKLNVYPDPAYGQAAEVVQKMLNDLGPEEMDIDNPELFFDYYRDLYLRSGVKKIETELEDAIKTFDFEETASLYQLIDKDAINILVPYDLDAFAELKEQALSKGLTRQWMAKARMHTVGIFKPRGKYTAVYQALDTIPLLGKKSGQDSRDWFILRDAKMYDPMMGFDEAKLPGLLAV